MLSGFFHRLSLLVASLNAVLGYSPKPFANVKTISHNMERTGIMDESRDSGVDEWDQSYALNDSGTLWGEPVPFVVEASQIWINPMSVALEVPCGDARNTSVLARHVSKLVAVDSSGRALDLAAERIRAEGCANVTFLQGNIYELPYERAEFGSVICWDLLAHLKKPTDALREIGRVCQPGGTIIANVYSGSDSTRGKDMVELGPSEYLYDGRFYYHYYSRGDVEALVSAVDDVEVLELQSVRWREPPHEGYREYEHEHESWAIVLRARER